MTTVHVVIPDGIDDPAQPSGGNTYDRRICHGLRSLGWSVHEHAVPGRWPRREAASQVALSDTVQRLDDDAVVLVDGLIASTVPEILVPHAHRLRLVVLVHMPLGRRPSDRAAVIREGAVLSAAAAIVTTSAWTRQLLLDLYRLPADRVHVAEPGVDAADIAPGTAAGGELLCVATLTFDKGQDLLLDALAAISDLAWTCVCVGSLERDPPFARELRRRSREDGLEGRVCFPDPGPDPISIAAMPART